MFFLINVSMLMRLIIGSRIKSNWRTDSNYLLESADVRAAVILAKIRWSCQYWGDLPWISQCDHL